MKVLSPENTEHEIVFIPRFYFDGEVVMSLYNEETSVTTTYEVTPTTTDGYVYLEFEEDFINNSNFQIKITFDDEVVFRDKLFITDQTDLQQYEITKDVFTL
jgi:hypothetical protein